MTNTAATAPQPAPARVSSRHWILPWLAVLVFATLFQGSRPLLDPDEGRYTAVALEMLESGNWLYPALGPEQPHLTKPVLTYWVIAGSMAVFGHNEWATRMPYALAFALTAVLVAGLAQTLRQKRPLDAGVIYALMLWPFLSANITTTDVLLTLFETLGALGYVRLWRAADAKAARDARLILALGFGLAFFTKGPPGLLPLAAFAVHAIWFSGRRGVGRLFDLPSVTLFVLIAFSWYAVAIATTPALLDYFLHEELAGRLAGEHGRNPQWYRAFIIYVPTLIIGSLPWAGYWLGDAWRQSRAMTTGGDATRRFLWLWFGLPLVVFMLAKSRLVMYVLPLFAPLALWCALVLEERGGIQALRWSRVGLALWALALVGVKAGLAYAPMKEYAGPLATELQAAIGNAAYERIATVGTKSHYGLRFYTGKIVEHFDFNGDNPTAADVLCERMRKTPAVRALLVNPGYTPRFESAATDCGLVLSQRGTVSRMNLYLADPLLPKASEPTQKPAGRPVKRGTGGQ